MKGEYRDDKDAMFSKYHHHQQQQTPPPFAITNHPFNLSNNTSEEADSRNNNNNRDRSRSPPSHLTNKKNSLNDGETIEVVRRPRGRPPGSKNKPKPPIIITREPDPAMSPYVLELPAGVDIVETVNNYCRTRNLGLCILTGSGTVTNVTLRQPTTTPPASVTFHGRFDILSISATVIPAVSPSAPFANGFTISLAGPQGQIVGGAVSGQLISGGTVFIIAASFNNPMYHRLGGDDDHDHDVIEGAVGNVGHSGAGAGGTHEQQSPPVAGSVGAGANHVPQSNESMSMYSVHLPSDVIWAPSARQASSHQPPY
ncbi:AT-hook motif nuclear-localized protein 17 [Tanacetum coccineum]